MMDCMMGGECMMGMGGMIVMWLIWIVLIGLAVWLVARFMRSRQSPPERDDTITRESPRETLDRRYAAGDISTEEYEERKRTLRE